jgi:NADH:ubiquinone oxidoreductase subunit C
MNQEEIKIKIAGLFPTAGFEEGGEWLRVLVNPDDWRALAATLKQTAGLDFDYLFCVTGVDWKTHLTMVYHISSTIHRHTIVVKSKLVRENPQIESVSSVWRTAEFHEREAFELFGINFLNHPDLRLLILPDGWEGKNPMRKDFEDPVNLIRL